MKISSIKSFLAEHKVWTVVIGTVLVVAVAGIGISTIGNRMYYDKLSKDLAKEEGGEPEYTQALSDSDKYVSNFKYAVDVKVGNDGFQPAALAVKPLTKIVFTGADGSKHFISVAPGSKAPKYFDPQVYVTSKTVFQTKLEDNGTYSFYDTQYPQNALVVTVAQ